jgi:hypothetical protein
MSASRSLIVEILSNNLTGFVSKVQESYVNVKAHRAFEFFYMMAFGNFLATFL